MTMLAAGSKLPRLSLAEYESMVARGLFDDERVELLRGEIVSMSPQGPLHADMIERLLRLLWQRLDGRARVRSQSPLALARDSAPEPDIILFPHGEYATRHPSTALLVVEVATTSLARDHGIKAEIYAESQIPEYWVIDAIAQTITVYTEPHDGRYRSITNKHPGGSIALVLFPDIIIPVAHILG